uniref:transcription factor bHLH148-like n=1 Tax=Erigeron canadensis TaxID=72917 RepID=UPI001CB9B716|nr:transcription factor bHLH148-like [Erigeron canadensis]
MPLSLLISNSDDTQVLIHDSMKQKKQRKMLQRQSNNSQMLNKKNTCNNKNNTTLWKSEMRQKMYSTKLLKALGQARLGSARLHGQAVHEAADRVLAMTAKGQSRWSQTILKNKLKCKFMKCKPRKQVTNGNTRLKKPKPGILKSKWKKNISVVARKGRDLGRIIPGCKKQALVVVLEEATDYIAALEMQVKAMATLADLFSGGYNSGFGNGAVDLSRLGISQTSTS